MVIHTDSFANERRFICILKCRRTRQTRVVSGWTLLRCLKGNCLWVTDMWASHLLGPHVMDTQAGALRHRSIVLSGWSRVSDDDDEDDSRTSPPHRSYLIYALVHRIGWSTNNVGRHNRRASQTPSSTASGALHRRCLPAHRGYFTEHIIAPPPPRPLGLPPFLKKGRTPEFGDTV